MISRQTKRTLLLILACVAMIVVSYGLYQFLRPIQLPDQGPPLGQNVTVSQRRIFLLSFQSNFERKFKGSRVSVEGEADKTLKITWDGISKPVAWVMVRNDAIVGDLRELGFRKLILTNGYKSAWDVDLRN